MEQILNIEPDMKSDIYYTFRQEDLRYLMENTKYHQSLSLAIMMLQECKEKMILDMQIDDSQIVITNTP